MDLGPFGLGRFDRDLRFGDTSMMMGRTGSMTIGTGAGGVAGVSGCAVAVAVAGGGGDADGV